jgi:4a-hydroxytetrahydrobiopterin dehydratase
MSAVEPPFGIAEVVGTASTANELRLCKIGGCCGKDTPLLPDDAVLSRMAALPDWSLSADGKLLSKTFVAKHWAAAMAFLNAMSTIAEDEGHHPDVHLTNWRDVRVELTTHAVGGLTMPDLVLAAKIDAIPVEYSPKWLRERQAGVDAQPRAEQRRRLLEET